MSSDLCPFINPSRHPQVNTHPEPLLHGPDFQLDVGELKDGKLTNNGSIDGMLFSESAQIRIQGRFAATTIVNDIMRFFSAEAERGTRPDDLLLSMAAMFGQILGNMAAPAIRPGTTPQNVRLMADDLLGHGIRGFLLILAASGKTEMPT